MATVNMAISGYFILTITEETRSNYKDTMSYTQPPTTRIVNWDILSHEQQKFLRTETTTNKEDKPGYLLDETAAGMKRWMRPQKYAKLMTKPKDPNDVLMRSILDVEPIEFTGPMIGRFMGVGYVTIQYSC